MNLRLGRIGSRVVSTVNGLFNTRSPTEGKEQPLEVDRDGTVLFKEDIIEKVLNDLEKRKTERNILELQWTLNANFLVGNQFCDINIARGAIEQIEPVYDWLERENFNQIAPLIETRIANLKKISYAMKVKPRTNELDDYAKADVSTAILQHTQDVTGFEKKKNTAIWWNELCGSCFWLSWWDISKGELYTTEDVVSLDADGNEQHKERAYYQGDIDYGLLTPFEVYPESIFKQTVEAQRSIILEQVKTVDEIYDLYNIRVEGSSVETFSLTPVGSGSGMGYENTVMSFGHRTMDNAEKVITYFEKPSKHQPRGKMIIIVGTEHLVYYGDLPYGRIPIVQMICREMPGQFFGKSAIEDLIPRQKAYNGCINRIHEYIRRIALGNLMIAEGSVDVDEYAENGLAPGEMLSYKDGYNPPVPLQYGALPTEIMTERYNLKTDMEYVAGTSQLMVNGATPTGINSGKAIENLMEIDSTRLSLTGDYIRDSVRELAILWLEIYKQYATTDRVLKYVGSNDLGKAEIWSNEDINSFDVEYTTENELLNSEENQKEQFIAAYNMGAFTDDNGRVSARVKRKLIEAMRVGQYEDVMSLDMLQIQSAQNENTLFEEGVVPEVNDYDDHEIHIDEHMRYVLQMKFKVLKLKKPDYAKALEDHINEHKQIQQNSQQEQMMQALSFVQSTNEPTGA